ncbi:S66 peptidase family protein [Candidatus Uabimicrobium amorphum]|uniref:LD-carboxypeptidase n=1 Tax=Uabimicrobium amorphum TaxID=2596890 RepID=A0A5S9F125_UABAM|nr:S66 peptidase family protein [Candidatus Uabimicrobium amorphum]BBM82116.1 LD-carboxypeptidase [Candidatus Uabimicrobium amorphum]
MQLIKPDKLKKGDTIGVFTPSSPAYDINDQLFVNGLRNLEKSGFKTKLGFLTAQRASQGYRSGTAQDRAKEFMELIHDDDVKALMSTIGGMNSSSLIPYLDFAAIRKARKVICGYSDVTSLHLAILKYAGLKTLYGPAVMTWFGEYPDGVAQSTQSFLQAATDNSDKERLLTPFAMWSNHCRDWQNGDWKNVPRQWQKNKGWKVLNPGRVEAQIVVANLNTLLSAAGTEYFPDIEGKILAVEEMFAPWSQEERSLRQLQLMGVFDKIAGFIMGKVEKSDNEGASFSLDDLLLEVVGNREYPIVSEFDCAHTIPMHTIGQRCQVYIDAKLNDDVVVKIKESFVV